MEQVTCSNGHPNPSSQQFCGTCGTALPQTAAIPEPPVPTSPMPPAAMESPKSGKRWWIPVAIVVAVAAAASGIYVIGSSTGSAGGPSIPKANSSATSVHTITGVLAANECGGFTQIANATVEVTNESGTIIGSATTGGDMGIHAGYACSVDFSVTGVPYATFYQVKVGIHQGPSYSYSEMQSNGWTIDLSLGKPSAGSGGSTTASTGPGSTRSDPILLGQSAQVGNWRVKVSGFSPDADSTVARANMFNANPRAGNQYVMVTVRTTFVGNGSSDPYFDLTFSVIPRSGNSAATVSEVLPQDFSTVGRVPNGASGVGNVAFQVKSQEAGSVVLYIVPSSSYRGNGTFFAVK